jgi:hypothetical protein
MGVTGVARVALEGGGRSIDHLDYVDQKNRGSATAM